MAEAEQKSGDDRLGSMISMRLSPREMEALRRMADQAHASVSAVARRAIVETARHRGSVDAIAVTTGTSNSAVQASVPMTSGMGQTTFFGANPQPKVPSDEDRA